MTYTNSPKVSTKYYCEKCDYYANRKSDLNKHFKSKKHNTYKYLQTDLHKKSHTCECGKCYKHRQSLNNHKKKCTYKHQETVQQQDVSEPSTHKSMEKMFLELMEKNQELQEQIIELASKPRTINNNSFNLNNFLNVQCKDAMNLSDFLASIEYTFKDLLYLGEKGFIKSLENTFVKQLGTMEQTKRPIHCTDKKRKTMYVKDENKWEKDEDNDKISSAIKTINKKQLSAFSQHSKERPSNYLDSDSNINTQHNIIQQMCGYTNDTCDDMNKKLICKLVDATEIKK